MKTKTTYCSACDKEIQVTLTPAAVHGGQATLPDGPEIVCLDFDACCSGGSCPLSGLPSLIMGVRLARSGLREEEGWSTIQGPCQGCGAVTTLAVLDDRHAYCTVCGTTNRWTVVDFGDDSYAALAGTG